MTARHHHLTAAALSLSYRLSSCQLVTKNSQKERRNTAAGGCVIGTKSSKSCRLLVRTFGLSRSDGGLLGY